jgi:hypothetical protein
VQAWDAETEELEKELLRASGMVKQFTDPHFTVDQALEYFPGMREEIEKEMVESEYVSLV